MKKFNEYKNLDLTAVAEHVSDFWNQHETFKKSVEIRQGKPEYVFMKDRLRPTECREFIM
ncbi:MAG: hypothetical protein ACXWB4_01305 [Kaistella sp.]